jgi:hypothetical protein
MGLCEQKKGRSRLVGGPGHGRCASENHNQLPSLFLAVRRPPGIFDVFPISSFLLISSLRFSWPPSSSLASVLSSFLVQVFWVRTQTCGYNHLLDPNIKLLLFVFFQELFYRISKKDRFCNLKFLCYLVEHVHLILVKMSRYRHLFFYVSGHRYKPFPPPIILNNVV